MESGGSADTKILENCIKIEMPFNLYQHIKSNGRLENLCRTCLSPTESSVSLLAAGEEGSELCLLDMLKAFTSIQVSPESGLPNQICTTCKVELFQCYNYKMKCEQSECTLQSLLKGQFIPAAESIAEVRKVLNKCDRSNLVYDRSNNYVKKEDFKEELDFQYLDDFDYAESDSEALYIAQEQWNEEEDKTKLDSTESRQTHKQKAVKNRTQKKEHLKTKVELINPNFIKKSKTVNTNKTYPIKQQSTQINSFPCSQCKEVFSSQHDLQLHLSVHAIGGPMWKCNTCPKEFKTRAMLRRHLHRHMESKRFKCPVCEKSFAEFYSLRRHSRVHTGETVEKKHICNICGKRYSGSNLLAVHMVQHSSVRPFVCAVCGKTFASARLLKSHRLVHTDDKPYACEYCDKRFRHDSTRNTHHRTHTGEKPYVCSTCGKTFIQNSNLRLHMRTHTGERPYSCDKCDRKFTSGSSLKIHMRTHTGEKPYSCKMCGQRFARMDLSTHMRKHTGERPHACNLCPKKFVNASRLRDHCRIHTGEKPFECATCTQTFPTKSYLIKHLKKHQSKIKQEKEKQEYFILPHIEPLQYIISSEKEVKIIETKENENPQDEDVKNVRLKMIHEMPLEVTGELVVQEEVLVVDSSQNQSSNMYLSTDSSAAFTNQCRDFDNVNLVTVNEGEVNILNTKSLLEGSTVKLYQFHQTNSNPNT